MQLNDEKARWGPPAEAGDPRWLIVRQPRTWVPGSCGGSTPPPTARSIGCVGVEDHGSTEVEGGNDERQRCGRIPGEMDVSCPCCEIHQHPQAAQQAEFHLSDSAVRMGVQ